MEKQVTNTNVAPTKKPYTSPEIVVYGSLQQVTQLGGSSGDDNGIGADGMT